MFNRYGNLASLPAGSFDTSNITTAADNFFAYFNQNGKLTNIPSSFKRPALNSTDVNKTESFQYAFNSTGYTINRNAADIINGAATPSNNRGVFSNNQPGTCDIPANWKVTTSGCSPALAVANPSEIQLTVVTTGANQTIRLNKYFSNAFSVNRGDSTSSGNFLTEMTKTYATS